MKPGDKVFYIRGPIQGSGKITRKMDKQNWEVDTGKGLAIFHESELAKALHEKDTRRAI